MLAASVARLYAYKAAWRGLRLHGGARALVRALGSDDPNVRTVAGMFLVQGGPDAEPTLVEALRRREHPELVLPILADVGGPRSEPELRRFVDDEDPDVRAAAIEALRVLQARVSQDRGERKGQGDLPA